MTTDDKYTTSDSTQAVTHGYGITDDRLMLDTCAPNGTCYDLDDARRALRDRPSMERELAQLRHDLAHWQRLYGTCDGRLMENRIECERLRSALREIVEMRRKTVDVTCQSDCRAGYEWCQMTARAALEAKEKE